MVNLYKRMKYRSLVVVCLVCLSLLAAAQVLAAEKGDQAEHHKKWSEEGHHCHGEAKGGMSEHRMAGRHQRIWRLLMKLDLDEAQRTAIREIRTSTAKAMIRKKADLKIARLELRELLHKEPVDMNAVEAQAKKTEGLRTAMLLDAIKAREEVKSKLTPEQRKKLKELIFSPEQHKSRAVKEKKRQS